MVKGELQKRIKKLKNKQWTGQTAISLEETLTLIEEAKKEFPIYFFINVDNNVSAYEYLLREWFLKWFGDSERPL